MPYCSYNILVEKLEDNPVTKAYSFITTNSTELPIIWLLIQVYHKSVVNNDKK